MKYRTFLILAFPFGVALPFMLTSCSVTPKTQSIEATAIEKDPLEPSFDEAFLRQGRVEAGVPVLNKVPYVNRLFMSTSIDLRDYLWNDEKFSVPGVRNLTATVSPDGNWLLVGRTGGGEISLFNLTDPKNHAIGLVPSKNDGPAKDVEKSENGEVSYEITDDGNFIYDILGTRTDWLRFTPDATAFLAHRVCRDENGTVSETMELFDRATGQPLRTIQVEPNFQAGGISPDGNILIAAGPSALECWELRTGRKTASVPLYGVGNVDEIQFTPDGRLVILGPKRGNIRIYDARSLAEVASISAQQSPMRIAVSPDGKTLCVVNTPTSFRATPWNLRLYEIGSWKLLRTIKSADADKYYTFHNIRFAQNGNRLFALGDCRKESGGKKPQTVLRSGLLELDLDAEKTDWVEISYNTLPLHAEGKFLLDGNADSARYLNSLYEILGVDFDLKFRANK